MALKPWYKVIAPREDLREERPLDASEFAVHLDQVRERTAPKVYTDPREFFERTFLTKSLEALAAEVVRRLSGIQVETSAVFNLATQFGGGKTHALTLLFHLAKLGSEAQPLRGVASIMAAADVPAIPRANVAAFVGTEFDSLSGRGGTDGTPLRKTPWGEIAFQLGGAEMFAVVAEHDRTLTAPGGDVISRLLPEGRATLILLDELLNYVSRSRKSGLGGQFHSFVQNLSEVARGKKNAVVAASIPASLLEMSADDHADFDRFKKLLDRLGKPMMMSAEAETSEIIRRRLFEWEGLPHDAKATVRDHADWVTDHRDDLPDWFPIDNAYEMFATTYPFHPIALSVFERKWRVLPRFQQTRGVLRLLALWVSRAFQEGMVKGQNRDPLITLGTAPLDNSFFRAAVFEQLGEQRLEGAVTVDIAGSPSAHAVRLDKEGTDAVRTGRLHRRLATTVFFESNGGQQKGEATVPEIRLAVGEPGTDLGSIDQCLESLVDACYYLHAEKNRYRFEFKANLNKLLADRRAAVAPQKIEEELRNAIRGEFNKGHGVELVFFPEKTNDVPDRPALILAVMGPDRILSDPGTKAFVETMAREHGQSSRVFKSAFFASAAEDVSAARDEARKLLAWRDILGDKETLRLDDVQEKQVRENLKKATTALKETVWQSYKHLLLLDEGNLLRTVDLGKIHSSAAGSIVELILGRLRTEDLLTDAVSSNTLVRNWPPALPEWSTRALRDAFYASPRFPRISSPEIVRTLIARAVTDGTIGYALKRGDAYDPLYFKKAMSAADVEIGDDVVVLRREDAEAALEATKGGRPVPLAQPSPSTDLPRITDGSTWTGGGSANVHLGSAASTPAGSTTVAGWTWEGPLPWQKWSAFYTKVCSRFSTRGLKLEVSVDVSPTGGVSEQEVEEIRAALRDLSLSGEVKVKK